MLGRPGVNLNGIVLFLPFLLLGGGGNKVHFEVHVYFLVDK